MATIAAGGITGIAIYVFGTLIHALVGLPAPVAVLFLVVVAKLLHAVPAPLEEGARRAFRFFVVAVTDPPLFCTAVALTPWHELVEAFHPASLVTITATVIALVATGYCVGRPLKMYPIETAIVNACHSGLGGTGDVMNRVTTPLTDGRQVSRQVDDVLGFVTRPMTRDGVERKFRTHRSALRYQGGQSENDGPPAFEVDGGSTGAIAHAALNLDQGRRRRPGSTACSTLSSASSTTAAS